MRTSFDDPTPPEWGMRCCDASEFKGAAAGRISQGGRRADFAEVVDGEAEEELLLVLPREGDLIRDDAATPLSPAEVLNPTISQPYLLDIR